jgi:hypothetical protein
MYDSLTPLSLGLLTNGVQMDKGKDTAWSLLTQKLMSFVIENSSPSTGATMGLQCAVIIQNP